MQKYLAVGVIALFIVGCGAGSTATEDDVNRLNEHANEATTKSKAPVKKEITAGDWEIGKKENLAAGIITSGTYVITTPADGFNCYWETLRNFDQTINSVVANGNIAPNTTARVVVKDSYKGLSLQGECLAKKQIKSQAQSVEDITDVEDAKPGSYCASSRLGKTFKKNGNTYKCGGTKPYRWRKV